MTMTRKHFIPLAEAFRESFEDADRITDERTKVHAFYGIEQAMMRVAAVCAESNPAFDKARFLQAATLPRKAEVNA